jgi:hypothetical protein
MTSYDWTMLKSFLSGCFVTFFLIKKDKRIKQIELIRRIKK